MADYPLKVKLVNKKINKPKIHISYPRAIGMESKLVQWRINRQIRNKLEQLIQGQGYLGNLREMKGSYKIMLNDLGLLSIRLENYVYLEGAAHGLTDVGSLNFDLKSGHDYSLPELFLPESPYQAVINGQIEEQLEEEDIPLTRAFPGITARQEYYLTQRNLVIHFQLYEFTPYAFGIPEFKIPINKLSNCLNPNLSGLVNDKGGLTL